MVLFFLLLLIYISIGFGMFVMTCLTNQRIKMEVILGKNYGFKLMYLWPGVVKEIYNCYWK